MLDCCWSSKEMPLSGTVETLRAREPRAGHLFPIAASRCHVSAIEAELSFGLTLRIEGPRSLWASLDVGGSEAAHMNAFNM